MYPKKYRILEVSYNNFYQDCYVRLKNENEKVISFSDIDYEFKPLCRELHYMYKTDKKIITKNRVIVYINNLPIPRILFILNYKLK